MQPETLDPPSTNRLRSRLARGPGADHAERDAALDREAKRCGCGRVHGTLAWADLRFVGVMEHAGRLLELRNCACGSTLGVELKA
jgi:hypothetical protein